MIRKAVRLTASEAWKTTKAGGQFLKIALVLAVAVVTYNTAMQEGTRVAFQEGTPMVFESYDSETNSVSMTTTDGEETTQVSYVETAPGTWANTETFSEVSSSLNEFLNTSKSMWSFNDGQLEVNPVFTQKTWTPTFVSPLL